MRLNVLLPMTVGASSHSREVKNRSVIWELANMTGISTVSLSHDLEIPLALHETYSKSPQISLNFTGTVGERATSCRASRSLNYDMLERKLEMSNESYGYGIMRNKSELIDTTRRKQCPTVFVIQPIVFKVCQPC